MLSNIGSAPVLAQEEGVEIVQRVGSSHEKPGRQIGIWGCQASSGILLPIRESWNPCLVIKPTQIHITSKEKRQHKI